jgi:methionyl aminopeptidase
MEKEILEKYNKAQSIAEEVLNFSEPLIKLNVKAFDIAEKIEDEIKSLGGFPAFPVNICVNEIAAHYTPDINDPLILKENDIVKVDFGVHVDGYISDNAFTVCIGKKLHPLIEASEKGLEEALKLIKPGTKIFEISEVVEDTLNGFGFNPIRNLCGHGLEQYVQHTNPTIPNGKNNMKEELKEGQVIAMEVFATTGSGLVKDSSPILIYRFASDKPTRMVEARKIMEKSKNDFLGLPFAKRWLADIAPIKIDMALMQLYNSGALLGYPVLKEVSDGLVAQAEKTVIL